MSRHNDLFVRVYGSVGEHLRSDQDFFRKRKDQYAEIQVWYLNGDSPTKLDHTRCALLDQYALDDVRRAASALGRGVVLLNCQYMNKPKRWAVHSVEFNPNAKQLCDDKLVKKCMS